MLIKAKTLAAYKLHGRDGAIGRLKEFYFDDRHWAVRHLVVDTGGLIPGRQVLISPYNVATVNRNEETLGLDLIKAKVEDSPPLSSDKPVSRQFEEQQFQYYGWPNYWTGPFLWGSMPTLERDPLKRAQTNPDEKHWDSHLRSTAALEGASLHATDGDIGHVRDFVIDVETWAIRYLVVGTGVWWPGKSVLISPQWIDRVGWDESKIFVHVTRQQVRSSPEYSEAQLLTRDHEDDLHRHYERLAYWDQVPVER